MSTLRIIIICCLAGLSLGYKSNKLPPAPTLITFNKTACYGTCPIYTLTINGKGKATFVGERFTEKLGLWEKQLSKSQCREFFDLMNSVGWDSIANEYPAYVSDLPSTIIRFQFEKIDKEVVITGDHPEILDVITNRLSLLAVSEGWENQNNR